MAVGGGKRRIQEEGLEGKTSLINPTNFIYRNFRTSIERARLGTTWQRKKAARIITDHMHCFVRLRGSTSTRSSFLYIHFASMPAVKEQKHHVKGLRSVESRLWTYAKIGAHSDKKAGRRDEMHIEWTLIGRTGNSGPYKPVSPAAD